MYKFILRRLIQSIPTFFGITLLAYLLMATTPGGPLTALYFSNPRLSQERKLALELELGVNDPLPVQYLRWLVGDDWMRWDSDGDELCDGSFLIECDTDGDGEGDLPPGDRYGVMRGDFGQSFFNNRPVVDILVERFPATVELNVASLLLGISLGILIGVIAAINRGGWFDNLSRVGAVVVNAVPAFWLGLIFLYYLAFQWDIFPLGGRCATTLDDSCPPIWERLDYMVLPVIILSAGAVAGYSRFMRASLLDVTGQDYIRTARAKGLADRRVWMRHGLRNALIPIATFLGPALVSLFGGSVIIENVFNYPGVGRTVLDALSQRDYPVVMAVTILAAITTIVGYLISDILYGLIDPRIRY